MTRQRAWIVALPVSVACLIVGLLLTRPAPGQAPGQNRGAVGRVAAHYETWVVAGDPPYIVVYDSEGGHFWSHPASFQAEWTDLGTPAKRRR
jgi:hypothetical protein